MGVLGADALAGAVVDLECQVLEVAHEAPFTAPSPDGNAPGASLEAILPPFHSCSGAWAWARGLRLPSGIRLGPSRAVVRLCRALMREPVKWGAPSGLVTVDVCLPEWAGSAADQAGGNP